VEILMTYYRLFDQ